MHRSLTTTLSMTTAAAVAAMILAAGCGSDDSPATTSDAVPSASAQNDTPALSTEEAIAAATDRAARNEIGGDIEYCDSFLAFATTPADRPESIADWGDETLTVAPAEVADDIVVLLGAAQDFAVNHDVAVFAEPSVVAAQASAEEFNATYCTPPGDISGYTSIADHVVGP
jgi:hypothetical protein